MAIIQIDCMNCQTTNDIDSSLAVMEKGVLMFNCSCTNCGLRLVSRDSGPGSGRQNMQGGKNKKKI